MSGNFFGSNLSINAGGATSGPAVEVDLGGPFGPFSNQTLSIFESVPRSTAVTFSSVGSPTNPMGLGAFIHVDGLGAPIDIDEVGAGARFFFQGSDGADTVNSGNLPIGMSISALGGADSITGGFGHDTINGGAGNDTIAGGSGGAIFDGGVGDDLFIGGAGNDRFDWDFGHDGHDTVMFFQSHTASGARDQIEISRNFGHSLADLEFFGFIRQVGSDVVLVNSTLNSFTLKNVDLGHLSDSDFVFI
jgi:Ca2+-binding RTX toxin-like protein